MAPPIKVTHAVAAECRRLFAIGTPRPDICRSLQLSKTAVCAIINGVYRFSELAGQGLPANEAVDRLIEIRRADERQAILEARERKGALMRARLTAAPAPA